jgi:hypothetical protein
MPPPARYGGPGRSTQQLAQRGRCTTRRSGARAARRCPASRSGSSPARVPSARCRWYSGFPALQAHAGAAEQDDVRSPSPEARS